MSANISKLQESFQEHGFIHLIRRSIEHILVQTPYVEGIYWQYSPKYYQWFLSPDILQTNIPINLFELRTVNPEDINRFSDIPGDAVNRIFDIGNIRDGEWDQSFKNRSRTLFTDKCIQNTVLYKSMKDRYRNNTPWENTELVRTLLNDVSEDNPKWHGSKNKEDVLKRCEEIDRIYEMIEQIGYQKQISLVRKEEKKAFKSSGLLNALMNEIVVDIGRSGKLLLVDGRHRLSIAKILGLEEIPVLVLVRHKQWVDKLVHHHRGIKTLDHPDAKCIPTSDTSQ
ncbi:ParB N-terminal domain-containing protein [Natronorubrum tibetense]|uniref:Uncharacterized protein n=1 Tax=Natronorubrum tibetense GA33 TaxID=1114856 RepID=L9VUV1_9EURY|nr:ParB N-terminal domain-containing protein [Natronorubrum tibetense]ELY40023.1 hypothetical protein C496_12749 [Natronorubrum tibetense GA33]